MSTESQAIIFFFAFLGCLLEAIWAFGDPAKRSLFYFRPGWLGLALFVFVFFWIAVKAT